jgi:hypothetical protein
MVSKFGDDQQKLTVATIYTPGGAAAGCDLLIFKNRRSKDRSLRQLL